MQTYIDVDKYKFSLDELFCKQELLIKYTDFVENEDHFNNIEFICKIEENYQGIFLTCNLRFDYDCSCYRCLENLTKHFERDFLIKLVELEILEKEEDKIYNSSEEIFVYAIENNCVDIKNIIYEQMNFALPLVIDCDNECNSTSDWLRENNKDFNAKNIENEDNPFAILKNLRFDELGENE